MECQNFCLNPPLGISPRYFFFLTFSINDPKWEKYQIMYKNLSPPEYLPPVLGRCYLYFSRAVAHKLYYSIGNRYLYYLMGRKLGTLVRLKTKSLTWNVKSLINTQNLHFSKNVYNRRHSKPVQKQNQIFWTALPLETRWFCNPLLIGLQPTARWRQ